MMGLLHTITTYTLGGVIVIDVWLIIHHDTLDLVNVCLLPVFIVLWQIMRRHGYHD